MKTAVFVAVAALAATSPAFAQDKPKPVCLHTSEMAGSQPSKDEKSITFRMRNGDVWRNDLRSRCSGIGFGGFSWVLSGDDRVCEDQQTLRVLNSGSICVLGKFTKLPKPVPKN
jgi:hypothetical protein